MPKNPEIQLTQDDYLNILEKTKKQYQQYVEVSEIYKLPTQKEEEEPVQDPIPSPEHPLTSNTNFQK